MSRFASVWFPYLVTDWFCLREPALHQIPFAVRISSHGRMVIAAVNAVAEKQGIRRGMVLADARAILPELVVRDDQPDLAKRLLTKLAEWCIRFSPVVAINPPDGLLIDVTGCTHLWKGDEPYAEDICKKLSTRGYAVKITIADTVGSAWGIVRYASAVVVPPGEHIHTLMSLPPEALNLEGDTCNRLHKLGLHRIQQFINIPRTSLRRRFGIHFLHQLDKAFGREMEMLVPVILPEQYQERLPCLEPIVTATGIEIALTELLTKLCYILRQDQKGLRSAVFKGYRVDGKVEQISIRTNQPSHSVKHVFKLLQLKISTIEPALGIDLFILEAPVVEEYLPHQEKMWEQSGGLQDEAVSELIDRLAGRMGIEAIYRYVPSEHYWPERSFAKASSLSQKPLTHWQEDKLRPVQVLPEPEKIEVTAPIPDYPPLLFIYRGERHTITKADGPERIEQEWWLQQGQHRDYYRVEDESGNRYWIFRLGHYHDKTYQWFLHGYFA